MDQNPNLSPQITHQPSLLGGAENMKLLFDDVMSHLSRVRSVAQSQDNAWETLRFTSAQDAQVVKHLAQLNVVTAAQTGQTENEQTVSPAGTAASETAKGAVADAGAGIAVAAEGVATANQAIADAVANLVNALTAVVVTASGGASTPSQTQAKPTTTS